MTRVDPDVVKRRAAAFVRERYAADARCEVTHPEAPTIATSPTGEEAELWMMRVTLADGRNLPATMIHDARGWFFAPTRQPEKTD